MKKQLWIRLLIITLVTAACVGLMYPPKDKIRLGKDLQGGVSITLQINIGDSDNWETIMSQVITVIKQRVNPTGLLDISVQAQGRDRIEIVMPLPNDEVIAARSKYEALLEKIVSEARITNGELNAALRENGAVQRFGGQSTASGGGRVELLTRLQNTYNDLQAARTALDAVNGQEIDQLELGRLQQAVADKEYELDQLMEQTLRMSLDQRRLVQAVIRPSKSEPVLDAKGEPVLDPATKKPMMSPSPRDVEVGRLKSEFPNLAASIDELVASYDNYVSKRHGLDDPEDLLRLLRGAGVLDFHIAVRPSTSQGVNIAQLRQQLAERGPAGVDSNIARWYPINDLKQWYESPEQLEAIKANIADYFQKGRDLAAAEFEGKYYLLLYTTEAKSMTHQPGQKWGIEATFRTRDEYGRPAVSFRLDDAGGALMSRMTGRNVGEPMAVVLDNEIYTAPHLNSQIGKNGVIVGSFSEQELSYLIRVLAAGSLEARLSPEPIAVNTLGPSVGADNLHRGLGACYYSVIAVAAFMLIYYFFAGFVANIALLLNGIIIFGVMAMMDGTFTLPGLAGIALTIGMAVDANVLIFERIREELQSGEKDLRIAIKLGYSKALSTIIDGNLTNLIVCVVLMKTATTEIQGFALTLMIGILASLFTALFVTRTIFMIYTDVFEMKTLPMLPSTVPVIRRLLEPNINWIGLRKFCIPLSSVVVLLAVIMIGMRGSEIFDTEFRGGTSMSMRTAIIDSNHDSEPDEKLANGQPARLMLNLAEVRDRVQQVGSDAAARLAAAGEDAASPEYTKNRILSELQRASVLTMGESEIRGGEVFSDEFQIKVASPSDIGDEKTTTNTIVEAVTDTFGPQLDITPQVEFQGAHTAQHSAYTYPITDPELGKDINEPRYTDRVNEFLGGVAVMLKGMNPPVTVRDLEHRIERMRSQPDFADCLGRQTKVIGLDPADAVDPNKGYRSAVVLVFDETQNYLTGDPDRWDEMLAAREWTLVSEALEQPPALQSVSSFSSAVADTLAAGAVVAVVLSLLAILAYIWFRFGSLRYSAGAVVALIHDATIATGALALSQLIGHTLFARALLIEDFHIDLGVVAALLTIIGYSLNDTIVVLDRIRENRGKMLTASARVINESINQTFSRTTLTSGTTLLATFILYVEGGTGIRPFTFVLLIGLIVGTYSSIAIAAPLVYKRGSDDPVNAESDVEAVFDPKQEQPELT